MLYEVITQYFLQVNMLWPRCWIMENNQTLKELKYFLQLNKIIPIPLLISCILSYTSVFSQVTVITSYSIHYTKLYEPLVIACVTQIDDGLNVGKLALLVT